VALIERPAYPRFAPALPRRHLEAHRREGLRGRVAPRRAGRRLYTYLEAVAQADSAFGDASLENLVEWIQEAQNKKYSLGHREPGPLVRVPSAARFSPATIG
jgi:hypothetical protein